MSNDILDALSTNLENHPPPSLTITTLTITIIIPYPR